MWWTMFIFGSRRLHLLLGLPMVVAGGLLLSPVLLTVSSGICMWNFTPLQGQHASGLIMLFSGLPGLVWSLWPGPRPPWSAIASRQLQPGRDPVSDSGSLAQLLSSGRGGHPGAVQAGGDDSACRHRGACHEQPRCTSADDGEERCLHGEIEAIPAPYRPVTEGRDAREYAYALGENDEGIHLYPRLNVALLNAAPGETAGKAGPGAKWVWLILGALLVAVLMQGLRR